MALTTSLAGFKNELDLFMEIMGINISPDESVMASVRRLVQVVGYSEDRLLD